MALSMPVLAQGSDSGKEKPGYSTTLTINSDAFFGLTPIASIAVPLTNEISFTGYAIFWSGIGNNSLFGHWTEFGGGVNFELLDGDLNINPQIGILNGNLLSRGAGTAPTFAEGVVPNITVFYENSGFELEFYYGYYYGTKTNSGAATSPAGNTTFTEVDPTIALFAATPEGSQALEVLSLQAANFPNRSVRNNYTHFWLFPGYQFTEWFSAGLHLEELKARPSGGADDSDFIFYNWRGVYVKFNAGPGTLRFAFGNSSASNPGPSNAQLLSFASDPSAALAYATTPVQANPMDGTYYRVTYSLTF
jgi:hypothetical protein